MADLGTEVVEAPAPPVIRDIHWICCREQTRRVCDGKVVGKAAFLATENAGTCLVCRDFYDTDPNRCPLSQGPCPLDGEWQPDLDEAL